MKEPLILTERQPNGVLLVTLNTPPLNLQTLASMDLLEEIVEKAANDKSITALVLTGAGDRAFCAGSDVKEFPSLRENFIEEKLRRENDVFTRIASLPFLTVAALNGSAMGGGYELALCCDFRILSDNARIGLPEINLGNFPGSGGPMRLTRLIGPARATGLMCLGGSVDAAMAVRFGLVNAAAPRPRVLTAALELAGRLARKEPVALRAIKELVCAAAYEAPARALAHAKICMRETGESARDDSSLKGEPEWNS